MHKQQYLDLIHQVEAIVWEADAECFHFTFVSEYAEQALGYPLERWLEEDDFWIKTIHPDDREHAVNYCRQAIDKREDHVFEYRAVTADGSVVWLRDIVRVVWDEQRQRTMLRGVMVDISEHKADAERLTFQATHDALTGLPNRNLLTDRLHQSLLNATRHEHSVGVLFFDLDRFKTVNDTLGHDTGDRLLVAVADRLRNIVRGGDTVARVGGDEFVMIINEIKQPHDAVLVSRKILDSFIEPFHVTLQQPGGGEQELHSSTSIGISLYPSDGDDPQMLLKNADTAMYRAKASGGNTFQFFTPEMDEQERERMELESVLRVALEQDRFELHYQPQVDLDTGELIGVEALLRLQHPEHGMVLPPEFIPILEETGLIVPVGEWVLQTACTQLKRWREAGLKVPRIAVNLSPRQLRSEDFTASVKRTLDASGIAPEDLVLEITESVFMHKVEHCLETLRQVHALGVRLSMDDFGTGYSSLRHLKQIPVSSLKADRVFVSGIPDDESDVAIVTSVIALAQALRLDVIAEGVETEAQVAFLRERGCSTIQGAYICEARPAEALVTFLGGH